MMIELHPDVARETLAALRGRMHVLNQDVHHHDAIVRAIAEQHRARVIEAGIAIAIALGETF